MWKTFHDYQPTTTDDMVLIYVVEYDVVKGSEPRKINIKLVDCKQHKELLASGFAEEWLSERMALTSPPPV